MDEAATLRATDPNKPLTACATILLHSLKQAIRDERGIRVENILGVIGALAGYACIAAVSWDARIAGRSLRDVGMLEIETANGERFYYGDQVNALLIERPTSVANLINGLAKTRGSECPDLLAIVRHVAETLGEPGFGVPRLPASQAPDDSPLAFVRTLWPKVRPILAGFCVRADEWPLVLTYVAMMMMDEARDVMDPGFAALILLECAIPMAKIDPLQIAD